MVSTNPSSHPAPAGGPAPPATDLPAAETHWFRLCGKVEGRQRSYLLQRRRSSLGSSQDNDLVIPTPGVSRRHLWLEAGSDAVKIEDRGSKNGTFVAGQRVESTRLTAGDTVTVGSVELVLERVPPGDATIAISGCWQPEPVPGAAVGPPGASTLLFPSLPAPALHRWLAAFDRALDALDGTGGPNRRSTALAAVLYELGGEAAVLLAREGSQTRVLAAAGRIRDGDLLDRLAPLLLPNAAFSLDGPPNPAAFWVDCRKGRGLGLAVSGAFPGHEACEPLLRVLARILGPSTDGPRDRPLDVPPATRVPELRFPAGYVISQSPAMRRLYRRLRRLAASTDPLLVLGETGVGKEPVGRILHDASENRQGPCVSINCAAIPGELLEAELFGVAAGAATGVAARRGYFAAARGGTLILDEIGELPLALQAKLLRAIDNREIPRLGGAVEASDARFIALTNRDLAAEVERGSFRADLYYRIGTHEVRIPPLRERLEDLPALVEHFLSGATEDRGPTTPGITAAALELLLAYRWPGNVRELQNEVRRLVVACPDGELIAARHLSPAIRRGSPADRIAAGERPSLAEGIEAFERRAIEHALEETEGNRTRAAKLLGIHRNSLAAKIERLGIDPSS